MNEILCDCNCATCSCLGPHECCCALADVGKNETADVIDTDLEEKV